MTTAKSFVKESSIGTGPIDGLEESYDDGVTEEPVNTKAYLDKMTRLLHADGLRFHSKKIHAFGRMEPCSSDYHRTEG